MIDKDGVKLGEYADKDKALDWARENLPGEQNTGEGLVADGWDIEAVR